jgi:hypothetical protein
VPAVHLWLLACLAGPPPRRRWRVTMVVAGALPLLAVAIYYLFALDLDPIGGAWYLLLLVTGHHVSLAGSLLASVLLGAGLAALQIARQPQPEAEQPAADERPRVYGPGGLAGPGSLGGTQSALRR